MLDRCSRQALQYHVTFTSCSLPVTALKCNIIKAGRNSLADSEVEGIYMYMT